MTDCLILKNDVMCLCSSGWKIYPGLPASSSSQWSLTEPITVCKSASQSEDQACLQAASVARAGAAPAQPWSSVLATLRVVLSAIIYSIHFS